MLALVGLGGWLRWRRQLYDSTLFLWLSEFAGPIGFVAVIAGWFVTEVGRQPWTVYGLLRTAHSVTPSLDWHPRRGVALELRGCLSADLSRRALLMLRIIRNGPSQIDEEGAEIEAGRPAAPFLGEAAIPASGVAR